MADVSSASYRFKDPLRQTIIGSELPERRNRHSIDAGARTGFRRGVAPDGRVQGRLGFYAHFYFELLMKLCT